MLEMFKGEAGKGRQERSDGFLALSVGLLRKPIRLESSIQDAIHNIMQKTLKTLRDTLRPSITTYHAFNSYRANEVEMSLLKFVSEESII
jgi:hypothetical protein